MDDISLDYRNEKILRILKIQRITDNKGNHENFGHELKKSQDRLKNKQDNDGSMPDITAEISQEIRPTIIPTQVTPLSTEDFLNQRKVGCNESTCNSTYTFKLAKKAYKKI